MNKSFDYTNKNGKRVTGTAAELHFIHSICGGMENFLNGVSASAIIKWTSDNLEPIIKEVRRQKSIKVNKRITKNS